MRLCVFMDSILFNWHLSSVFSVHSNLFKWKQDDENALLQQALAMSMDDPAINHDVKDTDMSEAAADDPELALGKLLCYF